jgi:hypothetical protein
MYPSVALKYLFLTSAVVAAVLTFAAVSEARFPDLSAADIRTGSVIPKAREVRSDALPHASELTYFTSRAREWLARQAERLEHAAFENSVGKTEHGLNTVAPELPNFVRPEPEPVPIDVFLTVPPPQGEIFQEVSKLRPSPAAVISIDMEFFIAKGEELLARGDVSGARLFFRPAADRGYARAALGIARTFDPKFLRTLRVYGLRGDAERAAYWYARSSEFERAR